MKRVFNLPELFTNRSLRSRLISVNIALATLAIILIAVIAVTQAARSNNYLASQFGESERQRAESNLSASAERYARDLDEFFNSIDTSMGILGENLTGVFAQEDVIGEGRNWDARQKLTRLPLGSWDNDNSEAGSIYLPAGRIPNNNYIEINTLKQMDFLAPGMLKNNPEVIAVYFGSVRGETLYYPNVDLANLLPADFDITMRPWYVAAAPGENPTGKVVWSKPYVDAASNGLVITCSVPVKDEAGQFRGVAAMDLQLGRITDLISIIRYGESGYAFVIDKKGHLIAISEKGYADFGVTAEEVAQGTFLESSILTEAPLDLFTTLAKMTSSQSGINTVEIKGTNKYIAYRPIPTVGYSLGLVVEVDETQEAVMAAQQQITSDNGRTLINLAGIMAVVWALFLFMSQRLGTSLTAPLTQLTQNAQLIADGDLNAQLDVRSSDEVGVLATTLNTMTANLRAVIDATEQRVIERTAELQHSTEESNRRAEELRIISEVARAVSAETRLETLLNQVTRLVSERFGFYHVGVFLIDTISNAAVLRAANSPGGMRMLARRHSLKVGQVGIVGNVAGAGLPRIALDVGADATFFDNPDLPETRSEMALPLKVRERIIGVLDVQSMERNAFTQENVDTLSVLADQIAIAIENARLLEETRQALVDIQAAYGESVSRAWERKTANSPVGYVYSPAGGRTLREPIERTESLEAIEAGKAVASVEDGQAILAVPIRFRSQTIGVVNVRASEPGRTWTTDEIAVVEATVERLALALENARLFEETSGRAAREHAVAEITSKIRQTNDPQAMIRTAMQELQRVLGLTRVELVPQKVASQPPAGKVEHK